MNEIARLSAVLIRCLFLSCAVQCVMELHAGDHFDYSQPSEKSGLIGMRIGKAKGARDNHPGGLS